ncbi:DUF262 domain-containing protein [Streptosporangium sp. OZ121]|uniref:DUF262 domain-containing protein n=1 Tax=Streptosporangium sp. OZ121 TaxID=3444183 RepID=UPI003F7A05DC
MGFLPEITVADALTNIHKKAWVLPAIQREFVWGTDQIRALFDSLMRGYPLGSLLLWKLEKEKASEFTFYDFLTNYHEKNNPYASKANLPKDSEAVAVLDGQQRLTALNIGLYGSHAERMPRKRADNPNAYPKKRLYLNLLNEPRDEELGLRFDLRFLTDEEADQETDGARPWFRVSKVLDLEDGGPAIMNLLTERGLIGTSAIKAFKCLYTLYDAVRVKTPISAYQEVSQDADRVLDIFVRVNSGGTKLSNSDLLLSMATNQWAERDAREEVRELVADLADSPGQFGFSKDLVLKTGLLLTEAPDFQFKISNFTQENMSRLENSWEDIRTSLLLAARLLASFGLSARNLTADSVVIPIAYYLHTRDHSDGYLTASAHAADRKAIHSWVFRSLLKRGVWGSGLDTLLRGIQVVLRDSTGSFPVTAVESAMAARGKALTFSPEEIDELLEQQYGKPRTFPTLALLYPGLDLAQQIHEDHIFPKSRFTKTSLIKHGVPINQVDAYCSRVNALPNLQLLLGLPNTEKGAMWPWEWLAGPHFPSEPFREQYKTQNDLDLLPPDLSGFLVFYDQRKQRLADRLSSLLGAEVS